MTPDREGLVAIYAPAVIVAIAACGLIWGLNERDAPKPGRVARGVFFGAFAVVQIGSAAVLAVMGPRMAPWYAVSTALVLAAWAAWRLLAARQAPSSAR
jgi:hypothetical protein